MGTPQAYLPPALSSSLISEFLVSIGFPAPTTVKPLQVAAQFHNIYLLHYTCDLALSITSKTGLSKTEPDGSIILVLRVAGRHLPRLKTLNEVGVMTWVRENTTIPVPLIIRYDGSEDNLLGHEFTLMEKAAGVSVDKVYNSLSATAKAKLVEQLTGFVIQLYEKPWTSGFVGGLTIQDGKIAQGPPIDEYFWQLPELAQYWGPNETVASLNPMQEKGYRGYTDYVSATVDKYIYAIERHESLASFRDLIPRLRAFNTAIRSSQLVAELDQVRYILAHRDLHLANVMYDPTDPESRITAVLDWEFSGVVPVTRWNTKAFLWNAQNTDDSKTEQAALERIFEERVRARGAAQLLEDAELKGLQRPMQTLQNYLRSIVEVMPRHQAQDRVGQWRAMVETSLEAFGL